MRKVSIKQLARNREIAKIKKTLLPVCVICGRPATDLAHLLPKSVWPEYYTLPENLRMMCRKHHTLYDDDLSFRQQQTELIEAVKSFDEMAALRYFKL